MTSHKHKIKKALLISFVIPVHLLSVALCVSHAETMSIEHVEMLFLEGRYERAAYEAGSLIDARSFRRDELYYIKGLSQLKLNRFSAARESFETLLAKYPASKRIFDARVGIGDSYFLEGKADDAVREYEDIMVKDPGNSNISVIRERLQGIPKGQQPAVVQQVKEEKASPPALAPAQQLQADGAASPPGIFSVQAGGFANKSNAEMFAHKLYREGYESFVETPVASGDRFYRVKVGRYKTRQEALALASKLKRDGYQTKICSGDRCE